MTIGIEQFREARELWLDRMLLQPFRGPAGRLRDYLEARGMNRRNLTFRAVLAVALLGAIVWLGLHREVLQAAALEQELARFGASAPILFVMLYASAR